MKQLIPCGNESHWEQITCRVCSTRLSGLKDILHTEWNLNLALICQIFGTLYCFLSGLCCTLIFIIRYSILEGTFPSPVLHFNLSIMKPVWKGQHLVKLEVLQQQWKENATKADRKMDFSNKRWCCSTWPCFYCSQRTQCLAVTHCMPKKIQDKKSLCTKKPSTLGCIQCITAMWQRILVRYQSPRYPHSSW